MVHEARGLDVNPNTIHNFRVHGQDHVSADMLTLIHQDEIGHVQIGTRWFRWCCEQATWDADQEFVRVVGQLWHGGLRGPFNEQDRQRAGMSPAMYCSFSSS